MKCATCGSFVEDGVCENQDTHPTNRREANELSFKQMMYQIVNENTKRLENENKGIVN